MSGAAAEGQYAGVKTSVWWDIESCPVAAECDPHLVAHHISSALAAVGYAGPLSVSAYGDTGRISPAVQRALSSTGVALNHVPSGIKDASDKKILVDMLFWAIDNPPPANYLLISGDGDFCNALHKLRMRRYNILLAQPSNESPAIMAAAKSVWLWKNLLAGGPPLPDSKQTSNALDGNASSVETNKTIAPCSSQLIQHSNQPGSSLHLDNQKNCSNGKVDGRQKVKQVWKGKKQSQTNPNAPGKASHETKQPSSENQDGLVLAANDDKNKSSLQHSASQASIPTTPSSEPQELQQNHIGNGLDFPKSALQTSTSQPIYSHQTEAMPSKNAPHEFFRANTLKGPNLSGSGMDPGMSCPDHSVNYGQYYPNCLQPQPPQQLKPSSPPDSQPKTGNLYTSNSQESNSYPPSTRLNSDEPFITGATGNLPDMSRLNICEYPASSSRQNISPFQQNPQAFKSCPPHSTYYDHNHRPLSPPAMVVNASNTGLGVSPRPPAPSNEVHSLMGNILRALFILKNDKMVPTEANIADCIHYGEMNMPNFNVTMALGYAVHHHVVVMHKLGGNLPFFIGKNDKLWKCVNIIDSNAKHPKETWDAVSKFLSSSSGHSSIMSSKCRYEAAIILKRSCLKNHSLGEVLQILHVAIFSKTWILPHPSGWQPLTLHIVTMDKNSDAGGRSNH